MKKHYLWLALAMLGICTSIKAQITVTNTTFPVVGDVLSFSFDANPNILALTPPGFQNWDYSNLNAETTQQQIFQDPSMGTVSASFPEATLLYIDGNFEYYYKVTNQEIQLLGYYGPDPIGLGFTTIIRYNPPFVVRRAPMNFFDSKATSSGVLQAFAPDASPEVQEKVDLLPFNPDSLRLRIAVSRFDAVEAFGDLTIPGGTFPVLREKRTQYRERRLDAKVPPLGWLDVTDIAIQYLGLTALGVDTTVTYNFFNDCSKEEIAILTLNNDQATTRLAQFKNLFLTANVTAVMTPICPDQDAMFKLTGTSNAEVTYNINGGNNETVILDDCGMATVTIMNVTTDQTLNLISVRNTSTNESANISRSAAVMVSEAPTADVSAAVTPICSGQNAVFDLIGTPNTQVTYNINGGTDQTTMLNNNGMGTVTVMNAMQDQTLNLISVAFINSSCSQSLTGNATVMTNSLLAPTAAISPDPATVCSGEQIMLNGNPMGGDGDFTHAWTGAGTAFLSATDVVEPTFGNNIPGSYSLTYTVTDGNGCTASDVISVNVLNCNASDIISITDPCSCKNNATTLTDGQFDETIQIMAPSGQNWTVANGTTGLYATSSAAPPAAPTPIAIGTPLVETPIGNGISNYTLTGIHIDAIGYTFAATNGSQRASINNTCFYPNPAIVGLDETYCPRGPAVTLMGMVDRGDGQPAATPESAVFDILDNTNMVLVPNATNFDPASLGTGMYSVLYTVDGANEFFPFPGCVQAVSQAVTVGTLVTINPLMPQTICSTKKIPLVATYNGVNIIGDPADLTYSWTIKETVGDNGMLSGLDPTAPNAGTYMPGKDAINRGFVTLVLTVDNACEPVSAEVQIKILKVDCGVFPWSGSN